jgi:hypothetical protein
MTFRPLESSTPRSSRSKLQLSFSTPSDAPAITLAAAAEGCLPRKAPNDSEAAPEPLFELMKRGAKERFGKSESEAVERFNRLVYWLKHETLKAPATAEVTNHDAWTMICRAVTKIEATKPGSETPAIAAFKPATGPAVTAGNRWTGSAGTEVT